MKRAQRKGIPDGAVVEINDRVWFVDHDGFRVVFRGWDTPLFRVAIGDKQELRAVAGWLRASRQATQAEIARAFGHSVESQRRWERRYEKEGLVGLSATVTAKSRKRAQCCPRACGREGRNRALRGARCLRKCGLRDCEGGFRQLQVRRYGSVAPTEDVRSRDSVRDRRQAARMAESLRPSSLKGWMLS